MAGKHQVEVYSQSVTCKKFGTIPRKNEGLSSQIPAGNPQFHGRASVRRDSCKVKTMDSGIEFINSQDVPRPPASSSSKPSNSFTFIQEFRNTFNSIEQLVERVLSGSCRQSRFRSLIWTVLLGVLDDEANNCGFSGDWEGALGKSRSRYDSLLKKHDFDARRRYDMNPVELEYDNPLSTHSSSSWNQYFINSELREEIHRDVVRTYPGNPLFRSQTMQNTLTDVLFIYAKEYPSISYKQGMHEILAAVLLVIKEGIESYVKIKSEEEIQSIDAKMCADFKVIFDPLYTEHDAYVLFESIMKRMHDWYWSPPLPSSQGGPISKPLRPREKINPISSIDKLFDDEQTRGLERQESKDVMNAFKRLNHMWNDILAMNDGELYEHLEQLGIIPTTFGINWLKLMYSRQFFDNFAFWEIWDVIFATNFILQDYVLVAMLHAIRTKLLASDNTGCNTLLVSSYPKFIDVHYIVRYSLYLFDGVRFPRPKESPHKKVSISVPSLSRDGPLKVRGSFSKPGLVKTTSIKSSKTEASKEADQQQLVNKSVELVEYLTEDEIRQSLDILQSRITSWKSGIDFNVNFLRAIFKDEDISEVEKFDKVLFNLKEISQEMKSVLRSSPSNASKLSVKKKTIPGRSLRVPSSSSAFGEEALNLIGNHR